MDSKYKALNIIGISLGIILALFFMQTKLMVIKFDGVGETSCDSDSMGLTLNCRDKIYYNYVSKNEPLELGMIYLYKKDNKIIIHRLVQCLDENCSIAVFKGDNNYIAEFVNRTQIIKKVEWVNYR